MYTKDAIEDYGFHFINDIDQPFVQLISIGRQRRCKSAYSYDNRDRPPAYLFQYTLHGSGMFVQNGKEHVIDRGKAFLIPLPSDTRYYFDEEKNEPWDLLYILFTGREIDRYCRYIHQKHGSILALSEFHPAITRLKGLLDEIRQKQLSSPFALSSRIFEIVCLLCQEDTEKYSTLTQRAKESMLAGYASGLGIAEIARQLGVSQSHLSRTFFSQTGQTPIDYLTRVRIEKAVDYLVGTTCSMEEIAALCGFSSGNYFNKVFRKYMHVSPGSFRQNAKTEGYSRVQI